MPRHRKLRGGDARSDAYGLTDTPQNAAIFAANLALAVASPMTGIPMLVAPILYSALSEQAAANDRARADQYHKTLGVRDEYQKREGQRRAQAHFAKYEAAHDIYLMKQAIVPVLLTEEDIALNKKEQKLNEEINAFNLAIYHSAYSQKMINNNKALQQNRQTALAQQSRERIASIQEQTAALQINNAAKNAAARQEQQEYMKAIATQKDVKRQQIQNYQDNLARSQNILSTQQNIVQQNQLANQRAQEQAAQIAAARPVQVATQPVTRPVVRLPPPVLLPRR